MKNVPCLKVTQHPDNWSDQPVADLIIGPGGAAPIRSGQPGAAGFPEDHDDALFTVTGPHNNARVHQLDKIGVGQADQSLQDRQPNRHRTDADKREILLARFRVALGDISLRTRHIVNRQRPLGINLIIATDRNQSTRRGRRSIIRTIPSVLGIGLCRCGPGCRFTHPLCLKRSALRFAILILYEDKYRKG